MARQDALQGSLPLLDIKLLARRGPLHGYGLATQIEGMSDETLRVEEGSLYPALHRLEEAGWIKARWTTTETGRRARVYEVTPPAASSSSPRKCDGRRSPRPSGKILKQA